MHSEISFEAQDRPLSNVLFSDRKYRVPRYQRPYAWDTEQIIDLWDDLSTNEEPYFLGSLIFNSEREREDGYVDIIDGQQRLLTLTILAAVLRDHAKQIDPQKAKLYQRKDIAFEDREGEESFRIIPSDTLVGYFSTYIQRDDNSILTSKPSTPEEERVRNNYQIFFDKISSDLKRFSNDSQRIDALNHLRKKIADLIVIAIEISQEEDAYEIFETTNARGLELSVADLLKNLVFKKIRKEGDRDLAKEIWQEITNNIESTNTDLRKFIRYYWISKYSFVTEKKLFKEIKKKNLDWQGLLEDLWDNSTHYNHLFEGSEQDFQNVKYSKKIYKSIFALRLMGVSQCYVFLMALLRNIDNLGTDPTRVFQLVEKFTFQYSVVSKLPTNRIEKIYSKYALKLEAEIANSNNKDIPKRVQSLFYQLEKDLKSEAPSEEVFKSGFSEIAYKNSEDSRKLIKYILDSINAHMRHTDENLVDFNKVNIEHVLAQNPDKNQGLSKKAIKGYVNKLGNLTLLSKKLNSKAQNFSPKEKLKELESSELPITKDLVVGLKMTDSIWGEEQILQRQSRLADLAYKKVWEL